jgi:hypothetical protein
MFLPSALQLLVTAYVVLSSLILSTLKMEMIRSSKMSVLTRHVVPHPQKTAFVSSPSFDHAVVTCLDYKILKPSGMAA